MSTKKSFEKISIMVIELISTVIFFQGKICQDNSHTAAVDLDYLTVVGFMKTNNSKPDQVGQMVGYDLDLISLKL